MRGLKRPERQHVDGVRQRLERLAALLMVDAGQSTMAVGIMCERDAHVRLVRSDGRLATRAPRPIRAAAADWNQRVGEKLSQQKVHISLHAAGFIDQPLQNMVALKRPKDFKTRANRRPISMRRKIDG
jgi:hypothetical protein